MIALLYISGYILAGLVVGKIIKNSCIMYYYRKELLHFSEQTDSYWAERLDEEEFEIEAASRALKEAKKQAEINCTEFLYVPGGIFWPAGIVGLFFWQGIRLINWLGNSRGYVFLSTPAERKINKMKNKLSAEKDRQEKLAKAIKVLKDAGVDVQELENLS